MMMVCLTSLPPQGSCQNDNDGENVPTPDDSFEDSTEIQLNYARDHLLSEYIVGDTLPTPELAGQTNRPKRKRNDTDPNQ